MKAKVLVVFCVLAWSVCSLNAAIIAITGSGWSYENQNPDVPATVHLMSLTPGVSMTVWIEKDFVGPYSQKNNEFPSSIISFYVGDGAVPQIIIDHETISNHTGPQWSYYEWDVVGWDPVFVKSLSANWSVSPTFNNWSWSGGSGDSSNILYTIGGTGSYGVPNGQSFNPAGGLVINATDDFNLKEHVIPDPATLGLILLGLPWSFLRRRLGGR